ncbi:MAG: hypothetical protein EBR82_52005 [Caulobacteraceae bacterium]|nr:hypothetical protein [Caulobacteraceae bacterium]
MKSCLNSGKETRSELCDLVAKFMAAHLEENNKNVGRLVDALRERDKARKELEEIRQQVDTRNVYAPVNVPPKDVAMAAVELHCQMRLHGVDGLFFGGLLASIPGGIK